MALRLRTFDGLPGLESRVLWADLLLRFTWLKAEDLRSFRLCGLWFNTHNWDMAVLGLRDYVKAQGT